MLKGMKVLPYSRPHSGLLTLHTIRDTSCCSHHIHNWLRVFKHKSYMGILIICCKINPHAFLMVILQGNTFEHCSSDSPLQILMNWNVTSPPPLPPPNNADHIRWMKNSASCPSDWAFGPHWRRCCSSTAWKAQWWWNILYSQYLNIYCICLCVCVYIQYMYMCPYIYIYIHNILMRCPLWTAMIAHLAWITTSWS